MFLFCFVRGREAGVCRNNSRRPSLIGSFKMILNTTPSQNPGPKVKSCQKRGAGKCTYVRLCATAGDAVSLYDVFSTVQSPMIKFNTVLLGACVRERQGGPVGSTMSVEIRKWGSQEKGGYPKSAGARYIERAQQFY